MQLYFFFIYNTPTKNYNEVLDGCSDILTRHLKRPSPVQSIGAARNKKNMSDICPKCNKKVYFAEQVKGAGATYHKLCFKCTTCNKMLDSSLCADKDNTLYCKSCYGKAFGPKGFGFGVQF